MDRRTFLRAGTLLVAHAAWLASFRQALADPASRARFRHGVASGEPGTESVLLWTRVTPEAPRPIPVDWVLGDTPACDPPLAGGRVLADPEKDYCVKVEVGGLAPGRTYYYRFRCGRVNSETGRTRTLPLGSVEALRFALLSCSNYPFGYFNAYRAVAAEPDLAFALHLGDFIYEYGPDGYGAEVGRALGRIHDPAHECLSLADYRRRYAQYKADPDARLFHAAQPLLPFWDDHESANDAWRGGAENHQPGEGDWAARRAAAVRAFHEWQPVRDRAPAVDPLARWRRFRFGNLADLVALETRHTGRSRQVDYADHLDVLRGRADRDRFLREVLWAPGRTLLGAEQEAFCRGILAEPRPARWLFVANQIPLARIHAPPVSDLVAPLLAEAAGYRRRQLEALARLGELDLPLYLDSWDGYPEARERLYRLFRDAGRADLIALCGDSHSFWLNRLHDRGGRPVGFEVGTTAVTSPGDFVDLGAPGAREMDRRLAEHNREVLWTEGLTRGYTLVEVTAAAVVARYRGLSTVRSRDFRLATLAAARIEGGPGGLAAELAVNAR